MVLLRKGKMTKENDKIMRSSEVRNPWIIVMILLLIFSSSTVFATQNEHECVQSNEEASQSKTKYLDDLQIYQSSPLTLENYSLVEVDQDNDSLADGFNYVLTVISSLDGNYTFTVFVSSQDPLQINANAISKTTSTIKLQKNEPMKIAFHFSAKEFARNALWGNLTIGVYTENRDTGHSWWVLTSEHRIEKESLDYKWNVKIEKLVTKTYDLWGNNRLDSINITLELNISENVVPKSVPIFAILLLPKRNTIYLKTEIFQNTTLVNGSLQIVIFSPYLKPLFDSWKDLDLRFKIILGPLTFVDDEGEFLVFETREIPEEFILQDFDSSQPSMILDGKVLPENEISSSPLLDSIRVIVQIQIILPIPYQLDIELDVTQILSQGSQKTERKNELQNQVIIQKSQSRTFEFTFSFAVTNDTAFEIVAIHISIRIELSLPNSFISIDQMTLLFSSEANSTVSKKSLIGNRLDFGNQAVIEFPASILIFSLTITIILKRQRHQKNRQLCNQG